MAIAANSYGSTDGVAALTPRYANAAKVFDGGTNLWAAMNDANALGLIIAMMMTAVVIVSLIYRASPKTPRRISWDGTALFVMYLGAMVALYFLS